MWVGVVCAARAVVDMIDAHGAAQPFMMWQIATRAVQTHMQCVHMPCTHLCAPYALALAVSGALAPTSAGGWSCCVHSAAQRNTTDSLSTPPPPPSTPSNTHLVVVEVHRGWVGDCSMALVGDAGAGVMTSCSGMHAYVALLLRLPPCFGARMLCLCAHTFSACSAIKSGKGGCVFK